MRLNPEKVLASARKAETADLLDRVTVFREAMEAEAVEVFEAELARRGLTPEDIRAHEREFAHRVIRRDDGFVARCSFCQRAATQSRRNWHKMWRILPIFKRVFYYCDQHWSEK